MGEAAADGAAIANRRMADVAGRRDEEGRSRTRQVRALDRSLAGEGANRDAAVVDPNVVESGQAVEIDQNTGSGEAHIKEGHQTLAPGQHLGLVAALDQNRERLVEASGRHVVKCRWFHRLTSCRADSAAQRRGYLSRSGGFVKVGGSDTARP